MVDSQGVIRSDRAALTPIKAEFASDRDLTTLADALEGADAFIGVSAPDTVTTEMLRSMAEQPIVFALANPDPEIPYDEARASRPDAIMATGRSDYPNQVNNVLGFPFIFRGALDVRARKINEEMKVAAARALADLARRPVPDSVLHTYRLERLEFGPEYLIPKPFDPRVLWHVAPAVAQAATDEGVARFPLDDPEAYKTELRSRFEATFGLMHPVTVKAQERPLRVLYPHGADLRIVRAARRIVEEGIAAPVLLGDADDIRGLAAEFGVMLDGVEIVDPTSDSARLDRYARALFDARQRKGMTPDDARSKVTDVNYMAALMLHEGEADAVLGGLNLAYPETLRPALQVLPLEEGRTIVHGVYIVIAAGHPFFVADSAVNPTPTAEQLAEIALATAELASCHFDVSPRVALVSYSNFGSAGGEEPARVQEAVRICRERAPDLPLDGEMQADIAVTPDLLHLRHPFNRLGTDANVLVFPNLTAANAVYKLLGAIGGAEIIGPVLTGVSKSVHVLQRDADVGDIVNLTAIAVLDAQQKAAATTR